jgi:hypothetical protein
MSDSCPCEADLKLLQKNPISNYMNNDLTNNMMNTKSTQIVNRMPNNFNNINNNTSLNNLIGNSNNELKEKIELINQSMNNNPKEITNKEQIRPILYILIALSIHEGIKFFINQSIRLNKGSSSRFLYYPVFMIVILILINLF